MVTRGSRKKEIEGCIRGVTVVSLRLRMVYENKPGRIEGTRWLQFLFERRRIVSRGIVIAVVFAVLVGLCGSAVGDAQQAGGPEPGDETAEVSHDVVLAWKPGDYAASHDVYLGTDYNDVNDAATDSALFMGNYDVNSFDPCGLELDTIYYWRVDEVNDTNTWKGTVWEFTVADNIIIDDFESYGPNEPNILDTWIDGRNNDTGSLIFPGFAPGDPVQSGAGSMKFQYDNSVFKDPGYYSEVELPFVGGMDWTHDGVKLLRLYFYGDPDNSAIPSLDDLYVGIYDGNSFFQVTYYSYYYDLSDIQEAEWHEWGIPTSDFVGASLSNVESLYIGFGDRTGSVAPWGWPEPGGTGVVYFDDIRLYRPWCVPQLGPDYDWSGNCIVDLADVGIIADEWLKTDAVLDVEAPRVGPVAHWELDDGSGTTATDSTANNNDGTLEGSTSWVAGHIGTGAVEFGGDDARIRVLHSTELMPASTVSVTAWIYPTAAPPYFARVVAKGIDAGDWEAYCMLFSDEQEVFWTIRDLNHWNYAVGSSDLDLNEWTHVAGTYNGDALKLYINGQLDAEDTTGGLAILQDANDLSIGNRSDLDNRAFIGTIDDVRVYDYALPPEAVAYIATQGTGYVPLDSQVNIYDEEDLGKKAVNFRDLAKFMGSWLKEKLWPW